MSSLFLETLTGKAAEIPPIWLMRQAGRYMKEYRDVRSTEPDFISFCLNSDKAVEVTLQPIDRFDFDAAIIFSDILLIPWALERNVRFVPGTGPLMDPLEHGSHINPQLLDSLTDRLAPVGQAISKCRSRLKADKALIGFAGAPWTVITYVLEGKSSRDFATARHWLWRNDREFDALLETITQATIDFLLMQARAGADALMLFDSWASAVPAEFRQRVVIDPARKIISALRDQHVEIPVIGFPKGIGEGLIPFASETGVQGVGIDHGTDIRWVAKNLPGDIAIQGNLDPLSLIDGGRRMHDAVAHIQEACAGRPHIFNLGHGITPETPVENVDDLVSLIRRRAA